MLKMKKLLVVLLGVVLLCVFPSAVGAETNTTGWVLESGKWHYYDENGAMKTGWLLDQGSWYYLAAEDGAMKTGWVKDEGKWYYLDAHGAMKTGWLQLSGKWYYLDSHGVMKKGWLEVSGRHYYLDNQGAMSTGWRWIGTSWYYFDQSGARATGWRYLSGSWYYFGFNDGVMVRQNFVSGYYLMKDGRMTYAGSSAVVSVVDGLKKWFDVGLSQADLKAKLGAGYHDLTGIEGENYWIYTLKVTDAKTFKVVNLNSEDFGADELASGQADVIMLAFWDSQKKAFQIVIDYFDAAHKFHHYHSSKFDYEYN